MPLLGLPLKVLRGAQISRSDVLDSPIEQVIAEGRLVLAVLSLFAVLFAPTLVPQASKALLILISYALFSLGLLLVRVWRFPQRVTGYLVHAADLCFQIAVGVLEGRANPIVWVFAFFVLVAASLRWDWQAVVLTALVLAVALMGTTILDTAGFTQDTDLATAVVQTVYVMMTAAMLAYYSAVRERRREQLTKLTDWPGPDTSQSDRPNLANLLAHCARVLEAPRVLVLWEEHEEPFVNILVWDHGTYRHTREMVGSYGDFVRSRQYAKAVFWTRDAKETFARMLDGPTYLQSPILDEELIETFAIRSVASAPFAGGSCRGRLLLLDRDIWSDFQLRLIQIVASRLANALDREIMQGEAKQAAADRERTRLTRDLHDGLLQSMTAAGLQIKLLADTQSGDTRDKLEMIRQLLNTEQRRIRDFVRKAPQVSPKTADVPIAVSLREVIAEIAHQWDCETSLSVDPPEATVSPTLCVHLSLMLAEAIANAVRHGGASTVRVAIRKTREEVILTVSDDGRGFNGATFSYDDKGLAEAGVGPFSLRERVRELGGLLGLKSSPVGVDLQIQLPVI